MYQPYPSGNQQPVPQPPAQPQPVRNAVLLMYAGAALSAIEIIIGLTTIASLKNAIRSRYPGYSSSQLHTAEVVGVTTVVVIGLIAIALWLWMAWANGAGKSWARVVATVFFGLNTIDLLSLIARPHATLGLLLAVLVWLVGLGAIVLLWRRESSAYYQARSARFR
jgi:hypothetical protein